MTHYSELAPIFVRIAVNSILIGTAISIGIFIILRLTRAAAPRARYLLTVTAFLAAAVLPFVMAVAPTAEVSRYPTIANSSSSNSTEIPGTPLTANIHTRGMEILPQSEPNKSSVNLLDSVVRFLSQPSLSMSVFTLWLVGACLLLGREAGSHIRVAKARHQWTPATAKIRERLSWPKDRRLFIDNEFGPCALGVFDSVVVIPARLVEDFALTAAQQIARHELDHLKWRDPFVHAAMRIVRALLWFNAPLWYLDRATRIEREAASDRAAVKSASSRLNPEIAAIEYAATLVSIARRCARVNGGRRDAWVAIEVGNKSGLNDRVERLMAISSRVTSIRLSFAFVTLLVTASALFVLPVAKLESKRIEDRDEVKAKQPTAPANQERFVLGPAKEKTDKPVRPSIVNRPLPGEVTDPSHESKLAKTPTEPIVEHDGSATPIAASPATADSNSSQPVPDLQLQILESRMAAVGYKNLTSNQLADMRAYAVGPPYVAEMADAGYSGLSADMLITFKWFAVSSSYIRQMKALGYDNLSPWTLVQFRQHGVSSDYIRQMRARVSGSISSEQLVSLRLHGASIQFVDKLKELGFANLNADQLITMRLQGVTIAYIEATQAQGHKGLSADHLIAMRMRGN